MVSKENFTKIITKYRDWNDRVHQVANVLGLDFLNSDWIEYPHFLFQDFINSHFNENGVDWINWWLFEKPMLSEGEELAWDENHNEILTETVEDLWNIVENYRLNDFEFLDKKE